jgi:hypothetical protein
MPDVLNALVAFVAEHQRCGDLDGGRAYSTSSGGQANVKESQHVRRGVKVAS